MEKLLQFDFLSINIWYWNLVLFVFGIIIGSFLNVVIYRLPIMVLQNVDNKSATCNNTYNLSLLWPASHCVMCKSRIPFWANIPIIGYLILKCRCAICKSWISPRYIIVELLTGILFVIAGNVYMYQDLLLPCLVFISFLICLSFIDYETLLLPDELTLSLLWIGILFNLNGAIAGSLFNSVVGAIVGYISLWIVFWGFKLITKRNGMGYGDFKLLSAILAWIGYQSLLPVLLISSSCGLLYSILFQICVRIWNKDSDGNKIWEVQVPFGPFLCIGGLCLILWHKYFELDSYYFLDILPHLLKPS